MKKVLALLLVSALFAIMVVGCGNGDDPAPPAADDTEAADTADDDAADDDDADVAVNGNDRRRYEGTTLNILLKTGYETEAITRFGYQFEEETGIILNVEITDEPTMRNQFILDVNAGRGHYDIIATQFWHMPEYINMGWMEPLDYWVENHTDEGWDSMAYMPAGGLGMFSGVDGTLYSTCVSLTGGVLIYRTDLFEAHGIPSPQTTDDIFAAAAILSEAEPDIIPFVGRGESTSASFGTSAGWAWGYGARVMDEQGNVTIDTPEMYEAMTDFVRLMQDYGPSNAAAVGWDTMSELFRQGDAAMNFEMHGFVSPYSSPEISTVVGNINVAVVTGPAGNPLQWMYGEGLGISAYSQNKGAAWMFLQWRNSLEVIEQEVLEDIRFDFPDNRIYDTDIYKERTEEIGFFTQMLPEILGAIEAEYWPPTARFEQVGEAFQQQISLAIAGSISVEEALANAQAAAEAAVAD